VPAEYYMSVETGEGVDAVLEAAVEAVGWEPELPYEG
jgi:nucleolar GTP-binding protein